MMVLVLIWPFCYAGISNTLYLLLTTGHFINTIFTHQKSKHMETQTFNIVAYQCLDFSSIIPKGKMPMCIYKNTLNIKLDWKPTGPLSTDLFEQGCIIASIQPLDSWGLWWTRSAPETKNQVYFSSLYQPGSPWLLKGPSSTLWYLVAQTISHSKFGSRDTWGIF